MDFSWKGVTLLTESLRMTDIKERLEKINAELKPFKATLVAVSKTHPAETIAEAYTAGQRIFGENKVQELIPKHEALPKDIQWHLIGHLQRNKVKQIAPFISLIHSVDSLKLLNEINKEAMKNERVIDCLLQLYIANEETKFGLSFEEAEVLLASDEFKGMKHVRIAGLMGMATLTENKQQIHNEFKSLKKFFDQLQTPHYAGQASNFKLQTLSMGMSSDYKIALEEGSNMVRIGTAVFGERHYSQIN
jgi:hypothetical protein